VEDKGEVRWVSLNRPDTHNAFNELVIGEITDAFRTIQRDAAQHKVHHIIFS
jgi:enoyl-CoA hydratase/carnithine racemase